TCGSTGIASVPRRSSRRSVSSVWSEKRNCTLPPRPSEPLWRLEKLPTARRWPRLAGTPSFRLQARKIQVIPTINQGAPQFSFKFVIRSRLLNPGEPDGHTAWHRVFPKRLTGSGKACSDARVLSEKFVEHFDDQRL